MCLYGIDAPELRSKDPAEKAKGQESQAFLAQWFERPGSVLVRTTKEEKFGWMFAGCYREAPGGAGLIDLQPALADGSHLAESNRSSTIRTGLPVAASSSASAWFADGRNSRSR